MLFQLNFETGMLLGAVSAHCDRDLYWGAKSLAKYLQLKTPHTFARTHATTQLEDLAGPHGSEIYSKGQLNIRLMTNDDVLCYLASSHSERGKLVHHRLSKRDFYVRMKKRDLFFPIVELCSQSDPDAIKFDQYILIVQWQARTDDEVDEDMFETLIADPEPTTTTAAGNDSILQYSLETPPRPSSPSLVALNASFRQSENSAFTPYSPTPPPYKITQEENVEGTYPGKSLNFFSSSSLLPPKKRSYPTTNETENDMIWLSGVLPKKVAVVQRITSLEFVPKD